jgi:hypothetical protein
MATKEKVMVEQSAEQRKALAKHQGGPIRLVDPQTNEAFVLLQADEYNRLLDSDASPWTDEEMDLLADEAGDLLDKYQPSTPDG